MGSSTKGSYWWVAPGVFVPVLAAILVTEALGGRRGVRTFLRSGIRWRVPRTLITCSHLLARYGDFGIYRCLSSYVITTMQDMVPPRLPPHFWGFVAE